MSDIQIESSPIKENFGAPTADLLWGAEAIAAVLGIDRAQAHYMLRKGQIKSAKKFGGKWVCSRSALLREFGA
jgi:Helix-turn-helix domain